MKIYRSDFKAMVTDPAKVGACDMCVFVIAESCIFPMACRTEIKGGYYIPATPRGITAMVAFKLGVAELEGTKE